MSRALAFLACVVRFVAESVDPSAQVEGLQAANNRLQRLVKAGAIDRHRRPGPGKQHLYHRKIEFWEKVPSDLMWHYLQVVRLRALFGANDAERSQHVCRVIADELERINRGEDPAGYLQAVVREARDRMVATTPPDWTDKQLREVKDAFE